jgi:CubicO group peptidase (beta-lactamase class C family)
MKYGAYVRQHIFEPAGLNNTFYDIVYGYNGLFQNYFPQFGYRQIVAPVSEGKAEQWAGWGRVWGGASPSSWGELGSKPPCNSAEVLACWQPAWVGG